MVIITVMVANVFNGMNTHAWTGWVWFAVSFGIVLVWAYTVRGYSRQALVWRQAEGFLGRLFRLSSRLGFRPCLVSHASFSKDSVVNFLPQR